MNTIPKPLLLVMIISGVALLFTELFVKHKGKFGLEETFGFYIWFGLLSVAALMVIAKVLDALFARKEDYYDEEAE